VLKATAIAAAAIIALPFAVAECALTAEQHIADLQVISSDSNARLLNLGFKKAITIDLPTDIKEVLVADPNTVKVVISTVRRVYMIGAAVGRTNVFFYDAGGRQIAALDICVSEIARLQPSELEDFCHRRQRDRISKHFLKDLTLSDK
jgi:pilus assembly protein CpaC